MAKNGVAQMVQVTGTESPRATLARWVREQIDGSGEVSIPDLKAQARAYFSADQGFMVRLLNDLLDGALYELVKRQVASTRGLVLLGDTVVTKDGLDEHAKRKRSQWSAWLEHVNGRHVRLLDMNREELLVAANERETRGRREYELAELWRSLADRLEGGQRLGERFSSLEIEGERLRLAEAREKRSA